MSTYMLLHILVDLFGVQKHSAIVYVYTPIVDTHFRQWDDSFWRCQLFCLYILPFSQLRGANYYYSLGLSDMAVTTKP